MSLYNRLLIHLPSIPLPARRRIFSLELVNQRHPIQVRLGTSDWYVVEEIFITGEYQPLLDRPPGGSISTVLDLGANVGISVRLWQSVWTGAQIAAVEPDPANIEMARRNALPISPAPVFVQACVAGRARTVHLNRTSNEYSFRMMDGNENGEEIAALTVPQICERAGLSGEIDLLKCDVEGAEAEVFADCAAWAHRVRHMVVEVHAPYTPAKLLDDLARAGVSPAWHQVISKGSFSVVFIECAAAGSATAASAAVAAESNAATASAGD
jgi:FkbM family methyltransferase